MKRTRLKFNEVISRVLFVCVLISTALVVRKEFFVEEHSFEEGTKDWKATYVEGWEDALALGLRVGSSSAPVQVVEFSDYQCPYCAKFEEIVQKVRIRFSNNVAFTFVPYPLVYHPQAQSAERAAECAYRQGRFDVMRSVIYANQAIFDDEPWDKFAEQAGVDRPAQYRECMQELEDSDRIRRSLALADRLGVQGTPTILINGWKWPVPPTLEHFDMVVENVANGKLPAADIDFFKYFAQD